MDPSPFQSLEAQRRQEDLCIKGRGKSVYLHPHSTLCLDTSLQGGSLKFSLNYRQHMHTLLRREPWEKLAQRKESLMNSGER